jgi:hypothetical protein
VAPISGEDEQTVNGRWTTMRQRSNWPECRWVPVIDGSGRRRLEMRWVSATTAATAAAAIARAA